MLQRVGDDFINLGQLIPNYYMFLVRLLKRLNYRYANSSSSPLGAFLCETVVNRSLLSNA